MNNIRNIMKLCAYEFRIQMTSKRVFMGYLIGIIIVLKQSFGYLLYTGGKAEPINVLEAFIIACNNPNTVIFLVLGWLLVISEAPFVNNISFYMIYRTKRKVWNKAMLLYIFLQGICYFGLVALVSILFGVKNGYLANVWSSPLMELAKNSNLLSEYEVYFPYLSFIRAETVFGAFLHTWFLAFLYSMVLGLFLYTFNLFSNQIAGILATFAFHFLGYEIMKEGFMVIIKYSLLARSIPVLQIGADLGVRISDTYIIFLLILFFIVCASNKIIEYTDLKEASKGEGE